MGYKIKRILVWTQQVRPDTWKPWANTIAYWELNGNWNDTKNNYWVTTYTTTNYDATWYIGSWNPTYTTTRNWKKCAYFDGARGLQLPYLPIPSNTLTFSAWVKLVTNPSWISYFFQLREDLSSGAWWSFFFTISNSQVYPSWIGTTASSWTSWQAAYQTTWITATLNTWYNLVATYNAGTLKFYVNGSLVDTWTGGTYLRNSNTSPSYIWARKNSRYSELVYNNCYVQDVIYENRVWSASDVSYYYNITK